MDIKKIIYIILGLVFFSIGVLGYYLPLLPGTVFLIISAYFFMNSSDWLYRKVVNNPVYGKPIRGYIENNIIPFKTKIIILLSMWGATLASIYITPLMRFPLEVPIFHINFIINLKMFGAILAAIGTVIVLRAKNE